MELYMLLQLIPMQGFMYENKFQFDEITMALLIRKEIPKEQKH